MHDLEMLREREGIDDMADVGAEKRRGGGRVWLRRLGLGLCLLLVLAAAFLAAVPWWLGTRSGTRWLMEQASRALAPASLDVERMEWSWTGPTRMRGFALVDAEGQAVIAAADAIWDRSLWQAIFDRPRLGRLRLSDATLDIDRREDGSVNLVETLKPVLGGGPETSLAVVIERSRLKVRAPELSEPVAMRDVELSIERPKAPESTRFSVRGIEDGAAKGAGTLAVEGTVTRAGDQKPGDVLTIRTTLGHWPIAVRDPKGGTSVRGRLEGTVEATGESSGWTSSGTMAGEGIAVETAALGGRVELGAVTGDWDLKTGPGSGLEIRRLEGTGAGSRVSATGSFPPVAGGATVVDGELDLAALIRLRPDLVPPRGDVQITGGRATWHAAAEPIDGGANDAMRWEVRGEVKDLSARRGETLVTLPSAARLEARATQEADHIALETLKVESAGFEANGRGDVDAGIQVEGRIDLAEMGRELAGLLPEDAPEVKGNGEFTARYRRREAGRYEAYAKLNMQGLTLPELPAAPGGAVPPPPAPGIAGGVPEPPRPGIGIVEEKDATQLEFSAEIAGSASKAGWPDSLDTVTADLSGGAVRGVVRVRPEDSGRVVKIERVEIGPEASAQEKQNPEPWLAASGEYREEKRTLHLRPLAGSTGAVALGAEGLVVTGLGQADWRALGDVVFDVETDGGHAHGQVRIEATAGEGGALATINGRGTADALGVSSDGGELELGPAAFGWIASIADGGAKGWELTLARVALDGDVVGITAAGRVEDLLGARRIELEGTVDPRWDRLSAQASERIGPDARVSGEAGVFRVSGPLGGNIGALAGDLSIALSEAEAFGMVVGRTPVRVWWSEGLAGVDPIESTLNGGTVRLVPEVSKGAEDGRWTLRLKEGTSIANAEINDEVSHRVLAYVAPVLDQATRVRGQVSASIREASIPLESGARNDVVVEGAVVFHDVQFAPGPLAYRIYETLNIPPTTLRLDQPVQIAIRDGLIHEQGFSLPLGNVGRIEMAGTVGFDRSLAMMGRVGMAAEQFATVPVFNQMAPALKIDLPIGGTLDDPKIDGKGVARSVGRMGLDTLKGVGLGSLEALIDAANRPPPTPEEMAVRAAEQELAQAARMERMERQREEQLRKKQERQLKREERRMRRPGGR